MKPRALNLLLQTMLPLLVSGHAAADLAAPANGDWQSLYAEYRAACPASAPQPCGGLEFQIFKDLAHSTVRDASEASKRARAYLATHPWPNLQANATLHVVLENNGGFYWHAVVLSDENTPIGHVWVKPDGTTFYPVGYK